MSETISVSFAGGGGGSVEVEAPESVSAVFTRRLTTARLRWSFLGVVSGGSTAAS